MPEFGWDTRFPTDQAVVNERTLRQIADKIMGFDTTTMAAGLRQADVTLSTAQVLALNATPVSLVAAPDAGSNLMNLFCGAILFLDYNSAAYAGVAAGEDLEIRYTDGSGQLVATIETTGFVDQTADQLRYVFPASTAAITPVKEAALVIRLAVGEIITGNSPIYVRTFYRRVAAVLP